MTEAERRQVIDALDERKAFEAWVVANELTSDSDHEDRFDYPLGRYLWQAWQAATAAERERAAKVVETQDTCGDYVGGWFSLLAEKIRKG